MSLSMADKVVCLSGKLEEREVIFPIPLGHLKFLFWYAVLINTV